MRRTPLSLALVFFLACSGTENADSGASSTDGTADGADGAGDGADGAGDGADGTADGADGTADGADGADGTGSDSEVCDDGVDNDGNGLGDCTDAACADDSACTCLTDTLGTDTGNSLATGSNVGGTSTFEGIGGTPGGKDASFAWSAPEPGCWAADTLGSTYDTILRSFDACDGTQLAYADDSGPPEDRSRQSVLVVAAEEAGEPYIFVVDSWAPDEDEAYEGSYVLSINPAEPFGGRSPEDLGSSTGNGVASGTTSGTDRAPASCRASAGGLVAYRWTAPADGRYVIDTLGSDLDTVLTLYEGLGCEELFCNDDGDVDTTSEMTVEVVGGVEYRVLIQGFNGYTGRYVLNINPA